MAQTELLGKANKPGSEITFLPPPPVFRVPLIPARVWKRGFDDKRRGSSRSEAKDGLVRQQLEGLSLGFNSALGQLWVFAGRAEGVSQESAV